MALTAERAQELLVYDRESGIVLWRATGEKAGWEDHGYLRIKIDGERHYLHRVIVLLETGRWPGLVDHADGDGRNNKWRNLREANHSTNGANRSRQRNNALGIKGVSVCKITGKFRVSIRILDRSINVGRFDTLDEARTAYKQAAIAHFGEFARA